MKNQAACRSDGDHRRVLRKIENLSYVVGVFLLSGQGCDNEDGRQYCDAAISHGLEVFYPAGWKIQLADVMRQSNFDQSNLLILNVAMEFDPICMPSPTCRFTGSSDCTCGDRWRAAELQRGDRCRLRGSWR